MDLRCWTVWNVTSYQFLKKKKKYISWHIRIRKFDLSPHTHTHSHTCRKQYIPNLVQLVLISDGVHFLDSSSLSQWLKRPRPLHPFPLPSPPPLFFFRCQIVGLPIGNSHQSVQTQNRIFVECVTKDWSLGAGLWGKILITNMIIKLEQLWGSHDTKKCSNSNAHWDWSLQWIQRERWMQRSKWKKVACCIRKC